MQQVRTKIHRWLLGTFTRATEANSRIIRRGREGATSTDLAVIAQQAALDYERRIAEEPADVSDEEE